MLSCIRKEDGEMVGTVYHFVLYGKDLRIFDFLSEMSRVGSMLKDLKLMELIETLKVSRGLVQRGCVYSILQLLVKARKLTVTERSRGYRFPLDIDRFCRDPMCFFLGFSDHADPSVIWLDLEFLYNIIKMAVDRVLSSVISIIMLVSDTQPEKDFNLDLGEFPNRRRPPCTTMPWNIWPALVVLWGVCWMFYPPNLSDFLGADDEYGVFVNTGQLNQDGKICRNDFENSFLIHYSIQLGAWQLGNLELRCWHSSRFVFRSARYWG